MLGGLDSDAGGCSCVPPDVQVAAGPHDVVELVNATARVLPRDGTPPSDIALNAILSTPHGRFNDPQVQYDALGGRWLVTALDVSTSELFVAVSSGEDPAGWVTTRYSLGVGCADEPRLGSDDLAVFVAAQVFSSGCADEHPGHPRGGVLLVIQKAGLYAGALAPSDLYGPGLPRMTPPQSLTSTRAAWIPAAQPVSSAAIRLFQYTGAPPEGSLGESDAVRLARPITSAPLAVQPHRGVTLDTGDTRPTDAVFAGARLHVAVNDTCRGRACVRVLSLDPPAARVTLDRTIGMPGEDDFDGALRPDARGGLDVVYAYSSAEELPGVGAAAIRDDTVDVAPVLARGRGLSAGRFGDYFGAAVDPVDPRLVWVAGQIGARGGPGTWSTVITTLSSTGEGLPVPGGPAPGLYRGRTSRGTRIRFRVGADGAVRALRASLGRRCVTGLRLRARFVALGASGTLSAPCARAPVRWVARLT